MVVARYGQLLDVMKALMGIAFLWGVLMASAMAGEPKSPGPLQIVAFGDSLTAGFGRPPADAFPAQRQKAVRARGYDVAVTHAGVSGDTTSGGLQRIDWAVPPGTQAVILELGANDALRGIDPAQARTNLDQILASLAKRGIPVLLAGMRSPQNWGKDYVDSFERLYPDLAERHGVLLYPFFMEGVALDPKLNLDDGLHPNTKGVARIVEGILPKVEALIEKAKSNKN